MNLKTAIFFVNHWPEPQSSAAGIRTREITHFLQRMNYTVVGISPQPFSEHSERWQQQGVQTLICDPNQSQIEDVFKSFQPELVVYDRFYMEEQFGWRAHELWPEALHIVDTSDLHCLRRARQRAVEQHLTGLQVVEPAEELFADDILREMASLHRADVNFVVSTFEEQWLIQRGFESERILCLPFSAAVEENPPGFAARKDFCFLGNFLHAPNLDAVKYLESELWPALRQKLPEAKLYLYGAYPPQMVSQLKGQRGIVAVGSVKDHRAALAQHLALVAPLRYGAGIKGKVLEAWATGTPVIGTAMTFEGILPSHPQFQSTPEFVEQVLHMTNPAAWQEAVSRGREVVRRDFNEEILFKKFSDFLPGAFANRLRWRSSLTGRMLRHHGSQSVKYLSRWIEEKNKKS